MSLSDYISFGMVLLAAVLFVLFSFGSNFKDKKKIPGKYDPEKKIFMRNPNLAEWNRKPYRHVKNDRHLQLNKTVRRTERDTYLDQKEKEDSKYIVSPWL